jgi:hypothetical protein
MNRRPWIAYLLTLVFACMIGGAYWLISLYLHSCETFDTIMLYRFGTEGGYGDSDYLPLIFALSRLNFHEFITFEYIQSYGPPFPLAMLSLHALLVAGLGEGGLVLADILIAIAWVFLIIVILRYVIRNNVHCCIISLVFVAGLQIQLTIPVIQFRVPRPFVTDLFMMALILTSFLVLRSLFTKQLQPHTYVLQGSLLGVSAQGDIALATIAMFATLFVFSYNALSRSFDIIKTMIAALGTAAGFIVFSIPLAVNRLTAPDDLLARWGRFPIRRLAPPMYIPHSYAIILPSLLLIFGSWSLITHRSPDRSLQNTRGIFGVIILYIITAPLAMPLSGIILGEGMQIHHFIGIARSLIWLGCVSGALVIVASAVRYGAFLTGKAEVHSGFGGWYVVELSSLIVAGALAFGVTARYALEAAKVEHQPRVWQDGWPPVERYRGDLDSVLRELRGRKYANARVLGTLDQQLGMWWVAVRGGFLFIPDTFLSTVKDEVIVHRTAEFMKFVGDDSRSFQSRLQQEYFQNRFISLSKWQGSASYTTADIDQYSPDQIERIKRTSVLDVMHVEMPKSERDRLTEIFLESGHLSGRLDLIILPNVPGFEQLPGPPRAFVMVYQNSTFRVWERDDLLRHLK